MRRFSSSAALEAAKAGKKKSGMSSVMKQLFGKSTREQLMSAGRTAPVATKIPHRAVRHNQALRDDYHYMTQLSTDKMAQKYAYEEDAYCNHKLSTEYAQYTKVFSNEIRTQVPAEDDGAAAAELVGDFLYYTRSVAGKNHVLYCRKHRSTQQEEILLDPNTEMAKHERLTIATMKIDEAQSKLLVLMDKNESELFDVHIKDLTTGRELPVEISGVSNAEWAPDGKSFFYTEPDHLKRPSKIYRHSIGSPRSQDELVFEESDDQFFVDIARTKDRRFMTINSNSKTTSELRVLDPNTPGAEAQLVMSRQPGTEFFLDHTPSGFVMIMADSNDVNYNILHCKDEDIGNIKAWSKLIPAAENIKVDDLDVYANHIVVYERHDGAVKIRVFDMRTSESKYINLPSDIGHVQPGSNLESTAETIRFTFSGPITPDIIYDYTLETGELTVVRETKLTKADGARKAFNPEDYTVRRVYVPSAGGVKVPMTLVHRKELSDSRDTPTLLHAYGSYGHNVETPFDVNHLPLLERGWCIAMAHVRGGGELGRKWYQAGRVLEKKNTFDDLTNCVQYLFDQSITSGSWLVGKSASAGGMPFAVLANENPGMFKALVLRAPFLDVVNTMCDETLPLTVHEYDEWGNPKNKEIFEYMYSYDPYWNIRAQEYPHMYIKSSLIDARVPPANHIRYVAKLRATKTDSNQVLLRLDTNFGHFGDSSTQGAADAAAEEFSFMYGALNIIPERL